VLDKIVNGPSEANHAFTAARTFFRCCEWLGNTVRGRIAAQLVPQFPESALQDGKYASVEELAESAKLHPKVVRHGLRFPFLSPNIVESVLNRDCGLTLRNLRKVEAMNWRTQHAELYEG